MTRLLLLLPFTLPFCGCMYKVSPPVTLTPVAADEAAAYPSQELGTRPPVLTGFMPLSKENLAEGWIRLFDGGSTYGWIKTDGKDTLCVKENNDLQKGLVSDKIGDWNLTVEHQFTRVRLQFEGDEAKFHHEDMSFSSFTTSDGEKNSRIFTEIRVLPGGRPLTESDWKPAAGASEAKWTDGVLELTGGSGMVETVKEYGDFVLQLEYFTDRGINNEGINSGVFFRCIPGENMNGYECQIFNSPPDDDYAKFIGTDTGGIFRRQVGRNVGPKDGEWNYLTIAARGPQVATWVNGIQVTDWTDTREEHPNPRNGKRLEPGTIQLQGHDPKTKILFRNFRIAEM